MPLVSHYDGIPDSTAKLSYPSLVFTIVTPLVVLARFLSRRVSGKLGADDWVILVSCVFAEALSIHMIVACKWAFGKHIYDLQRALVIKTLRLYFIAQILYKVTICLTKISILLLYIRLFVRPRFIILCWTSLGVIVAFTFATIVASIFQCYPVAYAFDKTLPNGKCIDLTAFWYSIAALNIVTDVVIIVLPIPVIVGLHLPGRTKGGLCGVFAMGVFVCITSILRITTLNIATSHNDTTWNSIPSSMWTIIESNLGIVCACLPALRRPLLFAFFSSAKSTTIRMYGGEGGEGRRIGGRIRGIGKGTDIRTGRDDHESWLSSSSLSFGISRKKSIYDYDYDGYECECECEGDNNQGGYELDSEPRRKREQKNNNTNLPTIILPWNNSSNNTNTTNICRSASRSPSTTRSLSGLSRLNIKTKPAATAVAVDDNKERDKEKLPSRISPTSTSRSASTLTSASASKSGQRQGQRPHRTTSTTNTDTTTTPHGSNPGHRPVDNVREGEIRKTTKVVVRYDYNDTDKNDHDDGNDRFGGDGDYFGGRTMNCNRGGGAHGFGVGMLGLGGRGGGIQTSISSPGKLSSNLNSNSNST